MTDWLILTATLPTTPSGLRVSVWRALKATQCASLREGVYLLPSSAPTAEALRALDTRIRSAGAESHLLALTARDAAQEADFRARFDRSEHYAAFAQAVNTAHQALSTDTEAQARRRLRSLEQQLHDLLEGDFFPGRAADDARQQGQRLQRAVEGRFSPGEPSPAERPVPRRDRADHQGRTWATRRHPGVDRLASAWLISRHIDRQPRFVWLADGARRPADALGFDFDGAEFTHVGERVSVEVLAATFGLANEPGLARLGSLVRCVDVGGPPLDGAPGLALLVQGLRALHPTDDDALLAAALPLFDALHAALRTAP